MTKTTIFYTKNKSIYHVETPYSPSLLPLLHSISAKWNKAEKYWEMDEDNFKKFSSLLSPLPYLLQERKKNLVDVIPATREASTKSRKSYFNPSDIKATLFKHQYDFLEFARQHNNFILSDQQGCISGDCKVQIKEKGKVATRRTTLKNLNKLFKKDKTIMIKCLTNGRFAYFPIKTVVDKGMKETITIQLETTVITCTPDHLIYTKDGWKQACELRENDEVFTNGKESCKLCGNSEDIISNPHAKFNGYCRKCMYKSRNGIHYKDAKLIKKVDKYEYVRLLGIETRFMPNYEKLGRANGIYEHHQVWYENTGHIVDSSKEVIHHINGIKTDNRFENLELLSISEHCKKHMDTKTNHLYQFNENLEYIERNGIKINLVPKLQKIISISNSGIQHVYDVEIDDKEIHNFICNNVVVHNCGKTIEIITHALELKRKEKIKHCLIIVCVNGLKYNWKEEVEKYTNETAYILGTRKRKDGGERLGGSKEKYYDLQHLNKIDDFFLILNIEALRYKEGKGRGKYVLAEQINELCKKNKIGLVAIDEFHKSSNPNSKQTRGLLKMKDAKHKIAATGTLITNSPMDAWVPLHWLGIIPHNYMTYKDTYAVMGGWCNKEIVGYKNLDHLNKIVNQNMIRRKKEDVLDLPPKVRHTEYIELNSKEKSYYQSILKELSEEIQQQLKNNKKINLQNALSRFTYLRQITGDANILFDDFHDSSKLARCKELVEEYVADGEKVVIFSQWTSITDRIGEYLKEYKPLFITGQVDTKRRQEIVNEFQKCPEKRVIIGTAGAMGTGLTLTSATNIIFLDSPWTNALKEQCEDRCHRIGTKGTVNIMTLVAKNTIDEYIEKIVYSKKELGDMVTEKDFPVSELPIMLEWLLEKSKI